MRELKTKKLTLTIKQVIELVKKTYKIFLDESFQVGTNRESRWSIAEKIRYFVSVILGNSISPIVWIDVKANYEYWSENDTDKETTTYYKNLYDQGYVYISLDGNNRTITLYDIDKNVVGLKTGTYDLHEVQNVKVSRGKNKIKDLTNHLKNKFYNRLIDIIVYTNITPTEAGIVFRAINDGIHLNGHQKRQSRSSELANWVRQIRKDFRKTLLKIFSPKQVVVLKGDEFIAKCLSYTSNQEISGSTLDSMYEKPGSIISAYLTKRDLWFRITMKSYLKSIEKYKWTSTNSVFDLWSIISDYKKENNIKIKDMDKFVTTYYKQLTSLMASKTTYESPDKKLKELVLTYPGLLSKTLNVNVSKFRRNIIRNLIEDQSIDEKSIVEQEDINNRFYTRPQKLELYEKQNGICPETKKVIPHEEIFDAKKWQADHKNPFDNGGKTTIENGQLICAVFNNKKSNKLTA